MDGLKIISPRHARGLLNNYAPLFQVCCSVFPRNLLKDILGRGVEMSVVLVLKFAMFMKLSLMIGCIVAND